MGWYFLPIVQMTVIHEHDVVVGKRVIEKEKEEEEEVVDEVA